MDRITKITECKLHEFALPSLAIVPLKVAGEKSSKPLIKLRDIVKKGQVIAKAESQDGVDVFSPIFGRVIGFDMYPLSDRTDAYCVFIENLDKTAKKFGDSLLDAKFMAMKRSLKGDASQNRFDLELDKLDNGGKEQESEPADRSADLEKMFNSKNEYMNFTLDEAREQCADKFESIPTNEEDKVFRFEKYADGQDILEHIRKCGVITQNGESLAHALEDEKLILIPCYDEHRYAYENMAVLCKHFDEIYQAAVKISRALGRSVVFLYRKGDELPDLHAVWTQGRESGVYKLCVKTTDDRKVLKKYFNIVDRTERISTSDFERLGKHFCVLAPTVLYTAFRALEHGEPQTTVIATIGGQGLESNGVFEISSGCTLEFIQQYLGGTHSDQDVEDAKTDAMEAVGEYYEYLDKYKAENEAEKKQEMQTELEKKKAKSDILTRAYVKTCKRQRKSCLGQIVFDDVKNGETHGNFRAVFELKNRRVYFLSVSQC